MSTSIADALATFTKSVLQTQADIECRAQAEVARAVEDAFKARNERDEAVRGRHSMELEAQRLERANDICKITLQSAEEKIAQQAQLIAKLEQQSSQLEQQSRIWQDRSQTWEKNYLRVEQERLHLIRKVEELTERLQQPPPSLLTPVSRQEEPPIKNRNTSSSHRKLISPSDTESPLQHPPQRTKPKSVKEERETRTTTTRAPVTPASVQKPPNPVATRLIRRVQAVVHVKQEDSDEDLGGSEHHTRPAKTPRKRSIVADEPQSSESDQHAEADDDEDDDDDDPIMMGAQPPRDTHHSNHSALKSAPRTRPTTPPSKKRKIAATTTRRK